MAAKKQQAEKPADVVRAAADETPRLKQRYREEIRPALLEEFKYGNVMQVPGLTKIVVNMGVGEAARDSKILDIFEGTCGGRLIMNYNTIGGVQADIAPDFESLQPSDYADGAYRYRRYSHVRYDKATKSVTLAENVNFLQSDEYNHHQGGVSRRYDDLLPSTWQSQGFAVKTDKA